MVIARRVEFVTAVDDATVVGTDDEAARGGELSQLLQRSVALRR